MKNIIEIENLEIKFKKFWALKGINLKIPEAQNIAIAGSNGSGKTTLIETMLGINKKTKGKIKINVPKNKIGIQFQDSNLPEGLTPRDIVNFFNSVNDVNVSDEKLIKLLRLFNMQNFIDRQAHSLSGGQRQKLNVLLATIHEPELLILDEVSTGLDIVTKNDILKYFTDHFNYSNSSIIIISHDEDEIRKLTERFVFLHNGEIIYDKPTKQVIKEFGTIKKSFDEIPKKYYKKNRKDWFLLTNSESKFKKNNQPK